jgi:Protein of unknown function (DUF3443)
MSMSKMRFNKFWYRLLLVLLAGGLMAACGGGGGDAVVIGGPIVTTPTPIPGGSGNVLPVVVDSGPVGNSVNRLYTSVTVCQPGSTTLCQTIDHVLVDNGSTGLRLLSGVMSPALNLARLTGNSGLALLNCAQFVDNTFAWGPVAVADILLAGKRAASVPIQVVADPAFNRLASACSSGDVITTPATLDANGILGIGLFKEDCGASCVNNPGNGVYYTCGSAACFAAARSVASIAKQVKNPVPLFATDNNGFLVDLPAVALAGAPTLRGSVVFGIGTQPNNQFTPGTVLTTNGGNFTTVLGGKSLDTSFIDTGSNGLFFDTNLVPTCFGGAGTGFYCPTALTTFSVTMVGANGVRVPVSFSINNAVTSFSSGTLAVIPTLAGNILDARTFDWGLPFFYGRRVFVGIEGQPSTLGTGPFYAF